MVTNSSAFSRNLFGVVDKRTKPGQNLPAERVWRVNKKNRSAASIARRLTNRRNLCAALCR
jgi:hypothetical protein